MVTLGEYLVGALWVGAVQANRRASFRRAMRTRLGVVIDDVPYVSANDLADVESMLGHPPRGRIGTGF